MLAFKKITIDSINEIREILKKQNYRTCDYTVGGLYMWASYFNYEYCVFENTLYIMGQAANEARTPSFAMPIGCMDPARSLNLLAEYCMKRNMPLIFSSIPEEALQIIKSRFSGAERRLDDWADYLYNSSDLATLTGHRYNKKRNHVNKFTKTYPQFKYERITPDNIQKVRDFFADFREEVSKDGDLFSNEEAMVGEVLNNYEALGFIGGMISVDGKVAAFSIGEVVNDTLFVHIEKASREYSGVYETICMCCAKDFTDDSIKFINREEDVGDLGLRASKESYHPVRLLQKYNFEAELDRPE